MPDERLIALKL